MYAIKGLFGILVNVSVNVINHVMLVHILNYKNCKWRKKLVDKLVDECIENFEEVKRAQITSAKEGKNKHKCSSCTPYIMLFAILFTINIGIGSCFLYFHWYLKEDVTCVKFGTRTQWNCIQATI